MKSKSFILVGVGLMTAVLTIPQINSAAQVIVCGENRPLTAQEQRECELARQRRDAELAGRRLVGTWYLNGDRAKPCQISFNGRGFEAKNERGETTRLVYVRDHREHPNGSHPNGSTFIRASDWGDLRGEVRHQSIEWANGTRWTQFR
jgi:hypothetical protein